MNSNNLSDDSSTIKDVILFPHMKPQAGNDAEAKDSKAE